MAQYRICLLVMDEGVAFPKALGSPLTREDGPLHWDSTPGMWYFGENGLGVLATLNVFGDEGWELSASENNVWYFKRELP